MGTMQWLTLGGAGLLCHKASHFASINFMGNPTAYHNHWVAYTYVKTLNRWEGRRILKKAPMAY